ncbi:MAG TPA: zinc-binding dehydrogenase [Polyangiales bacterium]|nr:zinc-binding dehydrogenase [Polyangiales bacterium]
MSNSNHATGLQLRSTVQADGVLVLTLTNVPTPEPQPEEVVVRVEAAPLNPSDLGLLLAAADLSALAEVGTHEAPRVTAKIPADAMRGLSARLGQSLPVGNEGAGVVVATGSSPNARALLGKTVSVIGGAMYSQYRCVHVSQCLPLPDGTTPEDGASWFVNPLTALGMIETMRSEGHTALVHTAAASNLGQMLQKVCVKDGVSLVNIVRKPEQAALLREIGATYVCDSSSPTFMEDLIAALSTTSATIAFDAVGGGNLASQILTAMEVAASRKAEGYSRYGSTTHKQVYVYGALDRSATVLQRSFGMAWGIGGWLLTPFLQKAGAETVQRLRQRVANELKTTFASRYGERISLREALRPAVIAAYGKQATGSKYLITPHVD